MKFLERYLEKIEPHFKQGGKWEKWYPAYNAISTFFFVPDDVTKEPPHIRDANDLKRTMTAVIKALIPCALFGIWNIGHQHFLAAGHNTGITEAVFEKFWFGLKVFLPLLVVSYAVGLGIEFVFAVVRRHPVSEGFLVTGLLIPLTLPPTIPLWTVAVATAIGVIFGKEVFGGTGYNIVNPALFVRAILFFGYPQFMTGNVWVLTRNETIDGTSMATPLSFIKTGGGKYADISLWDAFWGFIPGSIGETSTFLCIIGGLLLVFWGVASLRIILSAIIGTAFMGIVFNLAGTSEMMKMPFYYHYVIGGYAFGIVFMATDPVSAARTPTGKVIYGFMIGVLIVFLRVLNPAYPEVTMLVILFMNALASLIDVSLLALNRRKRRRRWRMAVAPAPLLAQKKTHATQ